MFKKISFVCFISLALNAVSAQALDMKASAPMPLQKMQSVDAKMYSIDDVRGDKGTLVMFTCNTCPWVKAWQERMVGIAHDYMEKGVGVIFINSNDPKKKAGDSLEEMKKYAAEHGYKFPYVVDKGAKLAKAFDATRTPEVYLFNAKGKLVYQGAVDDNSESVEKVEDQYLRDALDAMLAGKEIEAKKTKAIGCTIKFPS